MCVHTFSFLFGVIINSPETFSDIFTARRAGIHHRGVAFGLGLFCPYMPAAAAAAAAGCTEPAAETPFG